MSFYLYNGIKLPVLPSTAYQFAYIKKESAVYRLFLLDSEAVWIGLEMFGDGNANGLQYICSTDGTEWTVAEDTTSVIADSNYPCIWCNTDMVKGIADGTIYLAASAPIPVTAWKFNLQDLLSGMAAAAASRGVLRRTPIAYLYNGVQLPKTVGTSITGSIIEDTLSFTIGYFLMYALRSRRNVSEPEKPSFTGVLLKSSDGFLLKTSDGLYLSSKKE